MKYCNNSLLKSFLGLWQTHLKTSGLLKMETLTLKRCLYLVINKSMQNNMHKHKKAKQFHFHLGSSLVPSEVCRLRKTIFMLVERCYYYR